MYADKRNTADSLRKKIYQLTNKKNPTGNLKMPERVRFAKEIWTTIVEFCGGSTGSRAEQDEDDFESFNNSVEENFEHGDGEDVEDIIDPPHLHVFHPLTMPR